jgi:hypothetical protein
VDVFDRSSGRMRSIIDIMGDFARATESMTEKERNRRVVTAFGARPPGVQCDPRGQLHDHAGRRAGDLARR